MIYQLIEKLRNKLFTPKSSEESKNLEKHLEKNKGISFNFDGTVDIFGDYTPKELAASIFLAQSTAYNVSIDAAILKYSMSRFENHEDYCRSVIKEYKTIMEEKDGFVQKQQNRFIVSPQEAFKQ